MGYRDHSHAKTSPTHQLCHSSKSVGKDKSRVCPDPDSGWQDCQPESDHGQTLPMLSFPHAIPLCHVVKCVGSLSMGMISVPDQTQCHWLDLATAPLSLIGRQTQIYHSHH